MLEPSKKANTQHPTKQKKVDELLNNLERLSISHPKNDSLKELTEIVRNEVNKGNFIGKKEINRKLQNSKPTKDCIIIGPHAKKNETFIDGLEENGIVGLGENGIVFTVPGQMKELCNDKSDTVRACYKTRKNVLILPFIPKDQTDTKEWLRTLKHESLHKMGYDEFIAYKNSDPSFKGDWDVMFHIEKNYSKSVCISSYIEMMQIRYGEAKLSDVKQYARSIGASNNDVKNGLKLYIRTKDPSSCDTKSSRVLNENGLKNLEKVFKEYKTTSATPGVNLARVKHILGSGGFFPFISWKMKNKKSPSSELPKLEEVMIGADPNTLISTLKESTPTQLKTLMKDQRFIDSLRIYSKALDRIEFEPNYLFSKKEAKIIEKRLILAKNFIEERETREKFEKETIETFRRQSAELCSLYNDEHLWPMQLELEREMSGGNVLISSFMRAQELKGENSPLSKLKQYATTIGITDDVKGGIALYILLKRGPLTSTTPSNPIRFLNDEEKKELEETFQKYQTTKKATDINLTEITLRAAHKQLRTSQILEILKRGNEEQLDILMNNPHFREGIKEIVTNRVDFTLYLPKKEVQTLEKRLTFAVSFIKRDSDQIDFEEQVMRPLKEEVINGRTLFQSYQEEFQEENKDILEIIEKFHERRDAIASFIELKETQFQVVNLKDLKKYAESIGATVQDVKEGVAKYMILKVPSFRLSKERASIGIVGSSYSALLNREGINKLNNALKGYKGFSKLFSVW